jgi:hypothetical protein
VQQVDIDGCKKLRQLNSLKTSQSKRRLPKAQSKATDEFPLPNFSPVTALSGTIDICSTQECIQESPTPTDSHKCQPSPGQSLKKVKINY